MTRYINRVMATSGMPIRPNNTYMTVVSSLVEERAKAFVRQRAFLNEIGEEYGCFRPSIYLMRNGNVVLRNMDKKSGVFIQHLVFDGVKRSYGSMSDMVNDAILALVKED